MNPVNLFPSRRVAYAFGFFVCAALMAYAYYLQYVKELEPCPMCWFQRGALLLMAMVFLIGAIVKAERRGAVVLAIGTLLTGGLGAALAARHLYIQAMPADSLPSCGMGITYMLESFPFLDVFSRALKGSVECNKVDLVLGLSIPAWTLIFFVLAVIAAFLLIGHRPKRAR